jgi:hypothetical protein
LATETTAILHDPAWPRGGGKSGGGSHLDV